MARLDGSSLERSVTQFFAWQSLMDPCSVARICTLCLLQLFVRDALSDQLVPMAIRSQSQAVPCDGTQFRCVLCFDLAVSVVIAR
jgi:hypothetical protein